MLFEEKQNKEGQIAERSLEVLRTQLTFDAEVRRAAASRRVNAIVAMGEVINETTDKVYSVKSTPQERDDAIKSYGRSLRHDLLLFGSRISLALDHYAHVMSIMSCAFVTRDAGVNTANIDALEQQGEAERNQLLDLLRCEMQLEEAASGTATSIQTLNA